VLLITNTDHGATEHLTSGSLRNIYWVQKAASQLYRKNLPLLHTSTQRPGTSSHVISLPRISTASNKCWGEKAWVRG